VGSHRTPISAPSRLGLTAERPHRARRAAAPRCARRQPGRTAATSDRGADAPGPPPRQRGQEHRVHAALDALLAAGREATVTAVARHAGVSRKFIYSHPPLRAQIEQRALQAAAQAGAPLHDQARLTIASLRADAANYRAQSQRLRQQVTVLERRLSELLGQQVATDLPDHHELAVDCERELRTELEHALAEAREELAAVGEISRELLAAHNRPG
jgi:hypothetical protein